MAPAETQLTKTMTAPGPDGSMRRAGERFAPHNTPRGDRLENDVAQEGARRIGTLAILTAVTVLGIAVLQGLLQPELAAHRTVCGHVAASGPGVGHDIDVSPYPGRECWIRRPPGSPQRSRTDHSPTYLRRNFDCRR